MTVCFIALLMVAATGCQGVQGEKAKNSSARTDAVTEEGEEKRDSDETGTGASGEAESEASGDKTGAGTVLAAKREEPAWEEKAKITLGDSVSIEGTGADSVEGIVSISEGGSYEITGTWTEGMLYIKAEEAVKLKLNGVSIINSQGPAIYVDDAKEVWIEAAEGSENVLEDGAKYDASLSANAEGEMAKGTIFSNDDLIFYGAGCLKVTGNYKHGICSDDSVIFQDGRYIILAEKDGVHAKEGILVSQGEIQVLKGNDGMESESDLIMNGGSYQAAVVDDGMVAAQNLYFNDGSVAVSVCTEGIEAKGQLYVNGGTIEVAGEDDGINGGTLVQINGGTVYVNMSTGDGLDSNGSLEMNGGLVIALGGRMPEGGADCDQNSFTITGGTLLAAGGVNSAPTEDTCTQPVLLLGKAGQGESLGIQNEDGRTVFAYLAEKDYENLLLSGDFLQEGASYTVYTGGTITGGTDSHGYYEGAEYTGGAESNSFMVDGMVILSGGTAGMPGKGEMGRPAGEGGKLEGMTPPEGGGQPEGMTPPGEGEKPEGMTPPEGDTPPGESGQPEGGTPPGESGQPEGGALPGESGQSEGTTAPELPDTDGEKQPSEDQATPTV